MLEPECDTHNIRGCVLMKCLIFTYFILKSGWEWGKTRLLLARIFLKEVCYSHTWALLSCFLICIFNLCNKIIEISVQFQTVETIGPLLLIKVVRTKWSRAVTTATSLYLGHTAALLPNWLLIPVEKVHWCDACTEHLTWKCCLTNPDRWRVLSVTQITF